MKIYIIYVKIESDDGILNTIWIMTDLDQTRNLQQIFLK